MGPLIGFDDYSLVIDIKSVPESFTITFKNIAGLLQESPFLDHSSVIGFPFTLFILFLKLANLMKCVYKFFLVVHWDLLSFYAVRRRLRQKETVHLIGI